MNRTHYERELSELHVEIIKMGSMIEAAIEDSITAFKTNDIELCEKVIYGDIAVNDMEKKIESMCLWLIAREQPVATDLRIITTALKMLTDIERIGDNAADIAEITMRIADNNAFSDSGHIPQMASIAISMVHDAITAYVGTDLELARATEIRDDEVDDYFNLVKDEIAAAFKKEDYNVDNAIDYLLIAKYLERIADHAVNICEWIEFSKTGTHKNAKIF